MLLIKYMPSMPKEYANDGQLDVIIEKTEQLVSIPIAASTSVIAFHREGSVFAVLSVCLKLNIGTDKVAFSFSPEQVCSAAYLAKHFAHYFPSTMGTLKTIFEAINT